MPECCVEIDSGKTGANVIWTSGFRESKLESVEDLEI